MNGQATHIHPIATALGIMNGKVASKLTVIELSSPAFLIKGTYEKGFMGPRKLGLS